MKPIGVTVFAAVTELAKAIKTTSKVMKAHAKRIGLSIIYLFTKSYSVSFEAFLNTSSRHS